MNKFVQTAALFFPGISVLLTTMAFVHTDVKNETKLNQSSIGSNYLVKPLVKADSVSLAGVIDFHCHTGPDITPRSVNDLQLVRLAREAGMRAIVLKNHYTMTADRAQLAMQEAGGIEVFGGIALNRSVGGINAEAVSRMVQFEGHRGRVVWLPTVDAENNFEHKPGPRKFVPVVKAGKPVAELAEVLQIIAKNDLVLETGHSSPEESLIIITAARQAGVKKIIVTHAMLLGASIYQMKQMATMGAFVECCWQPGNIKGVDTAIGNKASVTAFVRAIRAIGAEHFIIDSDLGQKSNPVHTVGMRSFIAALLSEGLNRHDIDLMARQNPAMLLELK